MCKHEVFHVEASVTQLTDGDDGPVVGFEFGGKVDCLDCGEPFAFIGLPPGLTTGAPTTAALGRELKCPIVPASQALVVETPGSN